VGAETDQHHVVTAVPLARQLADIGRGCRCRCGSAGSWMADMRVPLDVAWIVDDQVLAVDKLASCVTTEPEECPRWTQ